jgi:hypothetical protein
MERSNERSEHRKGRNTRFSLYGKALWGIVLLAQITVYAKPETVANWRLLGLEDRSINCILATDTNIILAGTSKGISLYFNSIWYDLNVEMPVTSIVRLSNDRIFVGAGNGSKSDAVYIGKAIINGPPFFHLEFQHYFLEPTAMVINIATAVARVYVGGRNTIAVGMIGNDTLLELVPMKTPENPFGARSPQCVDLLLNGATNLYAGGYDDSAAGRGSLITSVSDSFALLKSFDVTALAQGVWEAGPPQLLVGTQDAGILIYNPSSQTSALLPSPGNLPVCDVISVSTLLFADMFVVACDSGVFSNNGSSQTWTEVGAIPVPPTCLALRGTPMMGVASGMLLAGTAKGVYIYDDLPANVVSHPVQKGAAVRKKGILSRNGDIRISLENNRVSPAMVTIYTASGKVHSRIPAAHEQATFRLENGGLYFYDCAARGTVVERGTIMCTK